AAEALSEALGGLPLAHEQAASYCERLDISFAGYRERLETAPGKYLGDARYAPSEYHDGLTVAKTFGLAIDEGTKRPPAPGCSTATGSTGRRGKLPRHDRSHKLCGEANRRA